MFYATSSRRIKTPVFLAIYLLTKYCPTDALTVVMSNVSVALITICIAATVQMKYAILLVLVIIVILVGVKFAQIISKKYNKSFYNVSFTEGTSLHMLEIQSSQKIEIIEKNQNLKNNIHLPDQNEFLYRLAFENKKQLDELKEQLEKIENIKKIDINYV